MTGKHPNIHKMCQHCSVSFKPVTFTSLPQHPKEHWFLPTEEQANPMDLLDLIIGIL